VANGRSRQDVGAAVHEGGKRASVRGLAAQALSPSSLTSDPDQNWYRSTADEMTTTRAIEMGKGTASLLAAG
jgi:hypothetical protein